MDIARVALILGAKSSPTKGIFTSSSVAPQVKIFGRRKRIYTMICRLTINAIFKIASIIVSPYLSLLQRGIGPAKFAY